MLSIHLDCNSDHNRNAITPKSRWIACAAKRILSVWVSISVYAPSWGRPSFQVICSVAEIRWNKVKVSSFNWRNNDINICIIIEWKERTRRFIGSNAPWEENRIRPSLSIPLLFHLVPRCVRLLLVSRQAFPYFCRIVRSLPYVMIGDGSSRNRSLPVRVVNKPPKERRRRIFDFDSDTVVVVAFLLINSVRWLAGRDQPYFYDFPAPSHTYYVTNIHICDYAERARKLKITSGFRWQTKIFDYSVHVGSCSSFNEIVRNNDM